MEALPWKGGVAKGRLSKAGKRLRKRDHPANPPPPVGGGAADLEDTFFEAVATDVDGGTAYPNPDPDPNWLTCVTAQGELYYYNSSSQVVQWEDPSSTSTHAPSSLPNYPSHDLSTPSQYSTTMNQESSVSQYSTTMNQGPTSSQYSTTMKPESSVSQYSTTMKQGPTPSQYSTTMNQGPTPSQ